MKKSIHKYSWRAGLFAAALTLLGTLAASPAQSTLQVLKSFSAPDGTGPIGGVVQGADGSLYGSNPFDGSYGGGSIFTVAPDGSSFAILHQFNPATGDPGESLGGVTVGSDGNLYGTSSGENSTDYGSIFRVGMDGTGFSTIYRLGNGEGAYPENSVIEGSDGLLYGTATIGATPYGTVFRLNKDGTFFQVIKVFDGGGDGATPYGLVEAGDGYLYGTCNNGGTNLNGTVFKLSKDGTVFQVIHAFSGADGASPRGGVIEGSDGALYGTTLYGGSTGQGTVFKLGRDGSGFTLLRTFSGPDGASPACALVEGTNGALYGTTLYGGSAGQGTIFQLNKDGSAFASLQSFAGTNGSNPVAGLIVGKDGAFYGTTTAGGDFGGGIVFRLKVVTAVTAHSCDLAAYNGLQPYLTASGRIARASRELQCSLAPANWIDENHVKADSGNELFHQLRRATQLLTVALNEHCEHFPDDDCDVYDDADFHRLCDESQHDNLSAAARQAVIAARTNILHAAQILGETLFNENANLVAINAKHQKLVDKQLDSAEDDIADAHAAQGSGRYPQAVMHYRRAWDHVTQAIALSSL